ncbi:MAG: tautomerase family protein [Gammaproteobacteria bacterium]|nr:tautomerase family protein [Gammaproteobacteria bacterium]
MMPLYRCIIPKDSLDYEQRHKIAKAFTDVHCGISAAPRSFVQVLFIESIESADIFDSHGNGTLQYDTEYFIAGGNRAGRPPEVRQRILEGLMKNFVRLPVSPLKISVVI